MSQRLVVLLGSEFSLALIRGLIRNGYAVLWHRNGTLMPSVRRNCSGIDWVFQGESPAPSFSGTLEISKPDRDRFIGLVEALGPTAGGKTPERRCGCLAWPPTVRELVAILERPPREPGERFRAACEKKRLEGESLARAKQLLIQRHGYSEPEAYAALRRMSMDQCLSLKELSLRIIHT